MKNLPSRDEACRQFVQESQQPHLPNEIADYLILGAFETLENYPGLPRPTERVFGALLTTLEEFRAPRKAYEHLAQKILECVQVTKVYRQYASILKRLIHHVSPECKAEIWHSAGTFGNQCDADEIIDIAITDPLENWQIPSTPETTPKKKPFWRRKNLRAC